MAKRHFNTQLAQAAAVFLLWAAAASLASAQTPLIEREPFDRVTVGAKEGEVTYDVQLVDLPSRRLPELIVPTKRLNLVLLDRPDEKYEVLWRSVKRIDFYEQMVLAEAESLYIDTRPEDQRQTPFAPDFARAYQYYDFLRNRYPDTPGLQQSLEQYLYLNAGDAFRNEQYAIALSILEELHRRNPGFAWLNNPNSLFASLSAVSDRILQGYVESENFDTARVMLERLQTTYGPDRLASVVKWRNELAGRAAAIRDQVRTLMESGRLREAHELSAEMRRIWPQVEGGPQLLLELAQKYPVVVVGVSQQSARSDATSVDDQASRRVGRLLHRSFLEFAGEGPEGGLYVSPLGTTERSDDGGELIIRINRRDDASSGDSVTGYDVARRLQALADPEDPAYLPAWGGLMAGVTVDDVYRVRVSLRRPHVLPEAMLQLPLEQFLQYNGDTANSGPYTVYESFPDRVRYLANPNYAFAAPGQPAEVIERSFTDWEEALGALKTGKIDVLDRIFPADAPKLQQIDSIAVGRYAFPTIHLLIPNFDKPFPANKLFRRALVYGIDRQQILNQVLLQETRIEGCRVISGPFSPGVTSDDALSYAYDELIEPRGVDHRLAKTLLLLAQGEVAKRENRDTIAAQLKPSPPPPLVLVHPAAEAPRLACQAIAAELKIIGLEIKLQEMPPTGEPGDYDLMYIEAAMWEPAIDAGRVLSAGGVARCPDPFVGLALRGLYEATNWQDVGARLKALHRDAYNELPVVPLWQLVDHFAYRKDLRGIGDRPVTLYQNIEQWRAPARILPHE